MELYYTTNSWEVLDSESRKNSDKASEALKDASSKKGIAVAKAQHKPCAIADDNEALNKKTPTELIIYLSNHGITTLIWRIKKNGSRT